MSATFQFVSVLVLGLIASNLHAQKNSDATRALDSVPLDGTVPHSGKVVYNQKYRYLLKEHFRQIEPGEPLQFVYLPVPPSNSLQAHRH